MKETLRIFLVKHRCYRAFVKNYTAYYGTTEKVEDYLKRTNCEPFGLIASAFEWEKTEQGISYWWSISNKWNEYLELQEKNQYEP